MEDTTTTPTAETTGQVASTATEVQTQASTASATPEQVATPAASTGATPATTEYAPNFKFKVYDDEKEFDDFVRPLITNKEMEEKVRDLYTKAHGLDGLKTRHEKLRTDYEGVLPVKQKYENLSETLGTLSHYVNKDDFDSFFQTLRIPEDKVYKWVAKKLQEAEMTPEQRAETEARRAEQHRLYQLEKQNEMAMSRLEAFEAQQNRAQLESVLAKPEIASVAQTFDAKVGRQGAFMEEVIKRGVTLYHLTKQDLSPEQVVQDLMQTLGKVIEPMAASPQGQPTSMGGQAKPPVIPNIQSRSVSPVKKTPRTIDELRKLSAGMA